ncbi:MAG: DUF6249 domain-containing protein [Pseudomonadota bacterium]
MNENVIAVMIPIVSVIIIGLVVIAYFHYRAKNRSQLQTTIQQAIEKGNELTPELIDRLAGPKPGPDRDLRRALVWLALGVGFILFGAIIQDEDAFRGMSAIGMFPLLIGVAYMVMWKLNRGD